MFLWCVWPLAIWLCFFSSLWNSAPPSCLYCLSLSILISMYLFSFFIDINLASFRPVPSYHQHLFPSLSSSSLPALHLISFPVGQHHHHRRQGAGCESGILRRSSGVVGIAGLVSPVSPDPSSFPGNSCLSPSAGEGRGACVCSFDAARIRFGLVFISID